MLSKNNKTNTFAIIMYLIATKSLVNSVNINITNNFKTVANVENDNKDIPQKNDEMINTNFYMATTPKITSQKQLSRYEKGLEDYDEAVARLEAEKDVIELNRANKDINPIFSVFNLISKSLLQNKNKRSTSSLMEANELNKNTKNTTTLELSEGRYIKGDPLNGYYDFLITEGSYKFWAAFQLATAALIIYSTFAAIYYSKVNPLTSDYDYVDYLSRSFNGRSMNVNNEDVDVDNNKGKWPTFLYENWFGTASHAFQFILESIDKVPQ